MATVTPHSSGLQESSPDMKDYYDCDNDVTSPASPEYSSADEHEHGEPHQHPSHDDEGDESKQQIFESLFQPNFVSKSYSSKKSKKKLLSSEQRGDNLLRDDDRTDSMISTVSMVSSSIGGFEVEMDEHNMYNGNNEGIVLQTPTFFPPPTIIEEGTPAAAAIRANAEVKVGSMSKAARCVNAQVLRRMVKTATLRGNFGAVKGKPPRVPPPRVMSQQFQQQIIEQQQQLLQKDDTDNQIHWEPYEYSEDQQPPEELACKELEDDKEGEGQQEEANAATTPSPTEKDKRDTSLYLSCNSKQSPSSSPQRTPRSSQRKSPFSSPSKKLSLDYEFNTAPGMPLSSGEIRSEQLMPESSATLATEMTALSHDTALLSPIYSTPKSFSSARASKKMKKLVKQKSSKTAKKEKKAKTAAAKKSYLKGKVIDAEHEKYTEALAVMWGVRTSIMTVNKSPKLSNRKGPLLKWEDFYHTEKYEFRPLGSKKTPEHPLQHTFKFKDYSPVVYAYLRRFFGIDDPEFLQSVCGKASLINFFANSKSGQFFFYSNCGKYIIKTMTQAESKFLRQILPDYFRYISDNPNTLLVKFFGMYRVKLYHLRKNIKFVIMNSVYYTDKYLHKIFDLKGSVAGRDAPDDLVKKDNDLRKLMEGNPDEALTLPLDVRERVRKQVVKDTDFLKSIGVMDYSMVVGIHDMPRPTSTHAADDQDDFDVFADDGSYIEGSELRESVQFLNNQYVYYSDDENDEVKRTKQQDLNDIKRMYWPYHRLYDLHGHRIMRPRNCCPARSMLTPRDQNEQQKELQKSCSFCSDGKVDLGSYFKGGSIPAFVSPISDRKDCGLLSADKTKIFYFGIIDILQEFNTQKKVEAAYRCWQNERLHAHSNDNIDHKYDASCVDPSIYASRFVNFFNQYCPEVKEKDVESLKKKKINIDEDLQEVLMKSYIQAGGYLSPPGTERASF